MTAVFVVVIVIAMIQAATYGSVLHQYRGTTLSSGPILIATIGLFFMNMLSWAPYVSDYSRYLPTDVSFRRTFWAIFGGNVISTTLFAGLGACDRHAGAHRHGQPAGGAGQGVRAVDHVLHGDQPDSRGHAQRLQWHAGVRQPGHFSKKFMAAPSRLAVRLTGILLIFVTGTILAVLGYKSFLTSFENFIGVLLFFFVPWSAINLVDYYLVKRGRYDVASFFTPNGIYGRIQWWACICYVITLAVQVPFLDQTFYTGPFVHDLGGADISWIVGFALASLLYLAGAKRFGGARQGLPAAGGSAS